MTHLDTELKQLKAEMVEMFQVVSSQLNKSKESLIHLDKDLILFERGALAVGVQDIHVIQFFFIQLRLWFVKDLADGGFEILIGERRRGPCPSTDRGRAWIQLPAEGRPNHELRTSNRCTPTATPCRGPDPTRATGAPATATG